MESLNDDEARSLRKMSTVQLRCRLSRNMTLIKATADEVAGMLRDALLQCMANLYAVLKEQVDNPLVTIEGDDEPTKESEDEWAEAEPVEAVPVNPPSGDAAVQIEALKLQLQLQRERLQREREMQAKELEVKMQMQEKVLEVKRQQEKMQEKQLEMQEKQREMQERDLELKRMEAASTEQLKRQELEVKRLEITRKTSFKTA